MHLSIPEAQVIQDSADHERIFNKGEHSHREAATGADQGIHGDGKKDLIAVDERATELVWFENPGWSRHILAVDVPRPINADCADIDGDGIPEVALAFRFETSPEKSVGNLVLLKSGKDVRQPWTAREIDRVPTAHRVRWIDPEGKGKKILLLGPLVGLKARPPLYDDNAPLCLYRPDEWKREILSAQLHGILHANNPVNWSNQKRQDLLTAGFQGIHRFEFKGGNWISTLIAAGDPRPCPECGSSEIQLGRLKRRRFLAAIEPWHGNQVVVYVPQGKQWLRIAIEDGMVNGHALAVGDLNGDGLDEIVGGLPRKRLPAVCVSVCGCSRKALEQDSTGLRQHCRRGLQDR